MRLLQSATVFSFWLIGAVTLAAGTIRAVLAILSPAWALGSTGKIGVVTFILVGVLILFGMSRRSVRAKIREHCDKLGLLAASLLFSALLMELVLSLTLPRVPAFLEPDSPMGWKPRANTSGRVPERLGQRPYSMFIDSNGLVNGVAGNGDRLLLLIGASMLWPYFDPPFSAPFVFSKYANDRYRIVNGSVTTYGTDQEYLRLCSILERINGVTDVAFFFLPLNNFSKNAHSTIEMKGIGKVPKPRFVFDHGRLTMIPPGILGYDPFEPGWLMNIGFVRAWSQLRNRIEAGMVSGRDVRDDTTSSNFQDYFLELYMNDVSDYFSESQQVTASLLAAIKDECARKNVQLHAFVFDSPVYTSYAAHSKLAKSPRFGGHQAMVRNVESVFLSAGMSFDWLILEADELIPNDIHPNKQGMEKIARLVMQRVSQQNRTKKSVARHQ